MAASRKPARIDEPRYPSLSRQVKDRIRTLARKSGFAEKASVADFLDWRAAERVDEAEKVRKDYARSSWMLPQFRL